MNEQKDMTTTGETISGQAPAPAQIASANPTSPSPQTLPEGYLSSGSMLDEAGIMIPEYIGKYAEALAKALTPFKASTFQRVFLTGAKEKNKKKVPYGAKKNCAMGMVTQAQKLVHRKKDPAPGILLDMVQAATATVKDPATFDALYMHLDAVYGYLLAD